MAKSGAALDLGSSGEIREGSSPLCRTFRDIKKKNNDGKTFILFGVVLLFHMVVLDVISRQPRYFFFLFLIFEMFTVNDLANLMTLDEMFEKECARVVKILGTSEEVFLKSLGLSNTWILNHKTRNVSCFNLEIHSFCGSFPVTYLLKTDSELLEIVRKPQVPIEDLKEMAAKIFKENGKENP